AAEKIDTFNGTSDEFAGWLFGIARKLASNSLRKSRRRATAPLDQLPEHEGVDTSMGPERQLVASDWVHRLLATLPPREREVVACLDVVQLDVAATARALDMTQVAVRVAHHRALKRLRECVVRPRARPALG
ncbi:MAG: RNA polymerase sigma factor, partial [Nocardioides sp.]